ncbi:MAG TPA: Gfo/Idh/MocA family oxidoreductase [Bacteriovoracaceae bacterium]|nr:Gfo/Idh/MocA family oxidoreductase [Bacteriovoracaceae bacterium]
MKILILGYSNIVQRRVLPALKKLGAFDQIEIASRKEVPGKVFKDYDTALKDSDAEIVYISMINSEHAKWCEKALKLGKHVIVDKPAFIEAGFAEKMVQLAREKNLCLSEALVYEYHSQVLKIKEISGNPTRITAEFSIPPINPEDFRYSSSKGGGSLLDQGPYAVSLGRIFFGSSPTEIIGRILSKNNVETAFSVLMTYPGGKSVVGTFGFDTQYRNTASIFGMDNTIKIDRIFSTTPDHRPHISVNSDVIELDAEDSFENFFKMIIEKLKQKSFDGLYKNILDDAKALHNLIESCKEKI